MCKRGDSWEWDSVNFAILHPQPNPVGSENDRSCVLRISTSGGVSTLLPGDIETYGEGMLLRSGALQQVEILLSPHHGRATSSGVKFINALQPAFVIHSTGFKNRFKFPKSDVTDRYHSANAKQLNTAHSGAIEFEVSDTRVQVSEYRKTNKRWWHRQ